MKLTWLKWGAVPLAVLMSTAGATVVLAQDQSSPQSSAAAPTPAPDAEKKPTIEQRKENQQDRIANGVKSGELTAGETANLEKKEAAINKETRTDRAANGGKLTGAEKAQVNRQQNQMSKQIYADKHNANTAHYGNNKAGQPRENQHYRIPPPLNSDPPTTAATANLDTQ